MIDNSRLIQMLLEARLVSNSHWSGFIAERGNAADHPLDYLLFIDCAENIDDVESLEALLDILERVYSYGCSSTSKLVTITFLERLRSNKSKTLNMENANIGQRTQKELETLVAYYAKTPVDSDEE